MSLLGDLVTGFFGNSAADKAADAQVKAAQTASATQLEALNRGLQVSAPNIQAGYNALAMQGSLLGNPNMVPQAAVQQAIGATQNPADRMAAYYQQNKPAIDAFYAQNRKTFDRMGRDPMRAAEHYYNTEGRKLGHQLPMAGGGGQPGMPGTVGVGGGAMMPGGDGSQMVQGGSTGIGVDTGVDQAYNTFLDSGFGRSALETTNADYSQLVGAFGAGGKSMSGSAIGALNDRNRRNTAGAFGQYYNALSGISGTGAQIGQGAGSQINATANNIAENQMGQGRVRASSYLTQGENNANMVNSGINALAGWFGGKK
jgi:hypothetical protein